MHSVGLSRDQAIHCVGRWPVCLADLEPKQPTGICRMHHGALQQEFAAEVSGRDIKGREIIVRAMSYVRPGIAESYEVEIKETVR